MMEIVPAWQQFAWCINTLGKCRCAPSTATAVIMTGTGGVKRWPQSVPFQQLPQTETQTITNPQGEKHIAKIRFLHCASSDKASSQLVNA